MNSLMLISFPACFQSPMHMSPKCMFYVNVIRISHEIENQKRKAEITWTFERLERLERRSERKEKLESRARAGKLGRIYGFAMPEKNMMHYAVGGIKCLFYIKDRGSNWKGNNGNDELWISSPILTRSRSTIFYDKILAVCLKPAGRKAGGREGGREG